MRETPLEPTFVTEAGSDPVVADYGAWQGEYAALTSGVGLVWLPQRTILRLRGADRASFLHNLSTQEIRKLAPGQGCETFLTNVHGKTIGHGYVLVSDDSLDFDTVAQQGTKLSAHLERYLIREDVQIEEVSSQQGALLLGGARAADVIQAAFATVPPAERMQHVTVKEQTGEEVQIARVDWMRGLPFWLRCRRETMDYLWKRLLAAGAKPCGQTACEAARIEAGTPRFGVDFDEDNLPQEMARDALAISFTKGCYLGQETVARIDALGHVNKTLVGVKWQGETVPPPGTELSQSGKPVGTVTSVTWSPALGAPLGLAMVRRGSNAPGAQLESAVGLAEVVSLPAATRAS